MRSAAVVACAVLASSVALAQSQPPPALMVPVEGKQKPIQLSEVAIRTVVRGFLAETRMTMTFENPYDRVLEGTLYFPLPEGATVSGYGLDINGQLVDGVVVEKEKGRVVFEKEVRKGVDPGLVEWTRGNNFKTRVYPIPARGKRTVSVRYVTHLIVDQQNLTYRLPLSFRDRVDELTFQIDVAGTSERPKVSWPGPGIQLTPKGEGHIGKATLRGKKLVGQAVVTIPQTSAARVLVEKDERGEHHFVVNDFVVDPRGAAAFEQKAPRSVSILWDASTSRAGEHGAELELLAAYFARHASARIDVELVEFRNAAGKPRRFTVTGGDISKLRAAIADIVYDGGTQMSSISPMRGRLTPDLYFLFSDGLSNFGNPEPEGLRAPVYAISSGVSANHVFLKWLSESTGGQYFNLANVAAKEVAKRVGGAPFSVVKIEGANVDAVYPKPGQPLTGQLVVTGKVTGDTKLTVHLGVAGEASVKKTYTVSRADPLRGDLLARYWGQQKVFDLAVYPRRNYDALVEVGKKYGLVTPSTSLIVLETLEQYLEHEIRPPKVLFAMREQWDEAMAQRAKDRKQEEESKLARILSLWEDRVEWWSTRFKYPKDFRYRDQSEKKSGRRMGRAAPSAPPPASEPMMEAEADMDDAREEAPAAAKSKDKAGAGGPAGPSIELKPWEPDTPYLRAIKKAPANRRFAVYLEQKKEHGGSPAFFLDCADFFAKSNGALGLQILSNIAELEVENAALLRVLAHRLAQLGYLDLAVAPFEEVLRLRPEEPQSYRDLGLVLAQQKQWARAMSLLAHVVMNQWDRFDEIELIALMELNAIIPKARRAGVRDIPIDSRLIKLLDLDVRISMTWDADLTDMDLWVIEPSGEKAYYGHNRTTIGGLVSRDFTQGYGPEEYVLRRAMPGKYVIKTNFYGSSSQTLTGAVALQLDLITNFGRKNEKRKSITLRLTERKETFTVGVLNF
jgi:tetratricopeptide (TPR) repeat protein